MDSAPEPRPTGISSAADRRTARQQIEQVLVSVRASGEPLRMRIPVTLYSAETVNRGYVTVPDSAWNLTFDNTTPPEVIEAHILAIGKCLVAITAQGSAVVLRKLAASEPEGSL